MPCNDGGPPRFIDYEAEKRARKRLDDATSAARESCRLAEPLGYFEKLSKETKAWFVKHKAEDAARLAREADARKERKALGLKGL